MPWSPSDAKSHDKKADTPNRQRQWSDIADSILKKTGSDADAIRIANGVIRKREGRIK